MAVYTKVSKADLSPIIEEYNIGQIKELKEIEQGIENSNFFLTTDKNRYVLTIYEKRVREEDLPFYLNLMQHLSQKKFPCPTPIKTKSGAVLSKIHNRPAAIVSFLSGKEAKSIKNEHIEQLGQYIAQMHLATSDFDMHRMNNMSLVSWLDLFGQIGKSADKIKNGLSNEIENELRDLEKNWPKNLPTGIVHADLFPDNVFFQGTKLAGIIDYYFACNDFLMYDLAICLNAWCFENNNDFNVTKARILLRAYNKVREISDDELDALPILARGAAVRFLLTRLYDWFNPVDGALVKPKDPIEYLQKLRFHKGIKSHKEYGL